MVEGTPLERVQVVNSGARVQIPPSPLVIFKTIRTLKTKQQCNPEKFQEKISERLERDKPKTVKKERLKLAKLILTGTNDDY